MSSYCLSLCLLLLEVRFLWCLRGNVSRGSARGLCLWPSCRSRVCCARGSSCRSSVSITRRTYWREGNSRRDLRPVTTDNERYAHGVAVESKLADPSREASNVPGVVTEDRKIGGTTGILMHRRDGLAKTHVSSLACTTWRACSPWSLLFDAGRSISR